MNFSRQGRKLTDLGVGFFACGPLSAKSTRFSNLGLVILGDTDGVKAIEPQLGLDPCSIMSSRGSLDKSLEEA